VLPFRSDRLTVALCPNEAALRLIRRNGKKPGVETQSRNFDWPTAAPLWKNVLSELTDLLCQPPSGVSRAKATLILSNCFIRFALLPWTESAQGITESQALALAYFESRYGDMDGWTIQADEGSCGAPRLACAIETSLIEALKVLYDARKITCSRLEPYFVTCWNHWQSKLGNSDALFVVLESGVTVIATLKQGLWHSVRTQGGIADQESLTSIISRESLLQGFVEPPPCYVHAPQLSGTPHEAITWLSFPDEPAAATNGLAAMMACLGGDA
jgi:hypothetical protein